MDFEETAQRLKLAVQAERQRGTLQMRTALALMEILLEVLQELTQEMTNVVYSYVFEKADAKYGP